MNLWFKASRPPTLRERMMERVPIDQIVDRLPLEQIRERLPFQMKPQPRSRVRRAAPFVAAGAAGAAFAYIFDPDRGSQRRAKARELITERVRRASHEDDAGNMLRMPGTRAFEDNRMSQASAR